MLKKFKEWYYRYGWIAVTKNEVNKVIEILESENAKVYGPDSTISKGAAIVNLPEYMRAFSYVIVFKTKTASDVRRIIDVVQEKLKLFYEKGEMNELFKILGES